MLRTIWSLALSLFISLSCSVSGWYSRQYYKEWNKTAKNSPNIKRRSLNRQHRSIEYMCAGVFNLFTIHSARLAHSQAHSRFTIFVWFSRISIDICYSPLCYHHSFVSFKCFEWTKKKTVEKKTWKIIIIEHFKYCDVIYSLKAINLLRASFPLLFHSFHSLMCYVHCAVVCVRSLRIL